MEWSEEVSCAEILRGGVRGRDIPGKKTKCKSPQVTVRLASSGNKKVSGTGEGQG